MSAVRHADVSVLNIVTLLIITINFLLIVGCCFFSSQASHQEVAKDRALNEDNHIRVYEPSLDQCKDICVQTIADLSYVMIGLHEVTCVDLCLWWRSSRWKCHRPLCTPAVFWKKRKMSGRKSRWIIIFSFPLYRQYITVVALDGVSPHISIFMDSLHVLVSSWSIFRSIWIGPGVPKCFELSCEKRLIIYVS